MKFFIDTANIDEIKQGLDMGMVDGVTTNPSLVAKEDRTFHEILKEICSIVDGPVSAEVVSLEADGMLREARELAAMSEALDECSDVLPCVEQDLLGGRLRPHACRGLGGRSLPPCRHRPLRGAPTGARGTL